MAIFRAAICKIQACLDYQGTDFPPFIILYHPASVSNLKAVEEITITLLKTNSL